jgi:esterase/lipase superfamily enzyme
MSVRRDRMIVVILAASSILMAAGCGAKSKTPEQTSSSSPPAAASKTVATANSTKSASAATASSAVEKTAMPETRVSPSAPELAERRSDVPDAFLTEDLKPSPLRGTAADGTSKAASQSVASKAVRASKANSTAAGASDSAVAASPTAASKSTDAASTVPLAASSAKSEPETGASDAEDQPWAADSVNATKDYAVVSVFYGTDRNPIDVAEINGRKYLRWFYATAICAVVSMVAGVWALRRGKGRTPLAVTVAGTIVTVALGVTTTVIRVQSEGLDPCIEVGYGNERGELQLGSCQVSVPKYHEVGTVERPSIFKFEFKQDPRKHVVLLDVVPEQADPFYASLQSRVQNSEAKEAFVFVHGYNVTFEDAARRTAQLAYDLKFEGAPIFFSWPSQGGLLKYAVDETNVAWAVPHLKQFMADIAQKSGAQSVHLIAHSMGNRALTSALMSIAEQRRKKRSKTPLFQEVILTAPDIDADVFKRDIVPEIIKVGRHVTLYASSNDEALALSKKLHGYPRAGETGDNLIVVSGIDTIDVSQVDTSLIGHSYYGNNDTVLADMFYLLHDSMPPSQREWLAAKSTENNQQYWVFTTRQDAYREASANDSPDRK